MEGARSHETLAKHTLEEALSLDEQGRSDDALPLYIQAAEQFLQALKLDGGNASYRQRAEQVIERVETIKKAVRSQEDPTLEEGPAPTAAPMNGRAEEPRKCRSEYPQTHRERRIYTMKTCLTSPFKYVGGALCSQRVS